MAIVINGSGTVTGLAVGGLPDGTVDSDTLASGIDKTSISDSGDATAITIDSSENVGIGVVPSNWPSNGDHRALQIGTGGAIYGRGSGDEARAGLTANVYLDATDDRYEYIGNSYATHYRQSDGNHSFWTAPSGSANGAITFTNRLEIKEDGRGLSQFTAKAWANFDGTGTPAFRDSHNCSSISDLGTGSYTINFSNNMANTNYCTSGASTSSIGYAVTTVIPQFRRDTDTAVANSTSASTFSTCATDDSIARDVTYVHFLVFGD